MATRLTDNAYVKGRYLDANISVSTISDLINKWDFDGQSVHMPNAFESANGIPYPIDFWYTPYGEDIKWEIKALPSIESEEDFELLKQFMEDFKQESTYYPMSEGFEFLVENNKYVFEIDENGNAIFKTVQQTIDEWVVDTVEHAVEEAVERISGGASESFDTLKEIEDWIKANSGNTSTGPQGPQGEKGADGKSAYDLWLEAGNEGSTEDFLASLKGERGEQGPQGEKGEQGERGLQGEKGEQGERGLQGEKGEQGRSAYEIWLAAGNEGSEEDFLISLKGEKGALDEDAIEILKTDILTSANTYSDKLVEGLATKEYVATEIAKAKLSGNTEIDVDNFATKEDIKDLASKDDIKIYDEGTSISIDEKNKISVKIASDTKEKNNFIEVNDQNELEVSAITLDAAIISEDIEVNGGEWADEISSVFDGKIPAGITFEEFLKKMVKREQYASEISTVTNFDVYCDSINTSVKSSDKDINEQIVEVGAKINIGRIETPKTHAVQTLSSGTFTYGYKIGESGEFVNSTLYTENIKANLIKSTSILQVLFTNIQNADGEEISNIYLSTENGDEVVVEPMEGYAKKGYNSITINYTGDTYSSKEINKDIYVATSLKNYYKKDEQTPNVHNITFDVVEKTGTIKSKYQFNGAFKYFVGGINDYSNGYWDSNRSDEIRNLEAQGWAMGDTIEVPYTFREGTKQQTVIVPSEYTKVEGRDRLNGPVTFNLVKEGMNFYNIHGYVSQYNVFVAPVYDGLSVDSFINITISK